MSFFWFSLVFMQEQLCSRVHSYGINLDVNCVGYTSGNEIIDFFFNLEVFDLLLLPFPVQPPFHVAGASFWKKTPP